MANIKESQKKGLDKKVIFLLSIFVTMALTIVLVSYFGNRVVDGARAYVAGEGMWTKAQKEAVLHLIKYVNKKEQYNYNLFKAGLEVNKGDKKARLTLLSQNPDYEKAYQGFLEGNNHSEDIPNMIWLLNNFRNVSYIEEAINIWTQGDRKIAELDSLGNKIDTLVQKSQEITSEEKTQLKNKIYELDNELTLLESAFSDKMGQAARWASNLVFWVTIGLMLILILIAGIVTIRTVQNIRLMYKELSLAQRKFRNVLDRSQDVIYEMDLNTGQYVFMSASVEDMIGFTVEEMLGKGPELVIERMHPEDKKGMEEELEKIQREGIEERFTSNTEFRVLAKNGEYVWVSNKRTLLFNEEGKPTGIVGSVRDISERKKYEEEIDRSLKEKEVLLQEIHHRVKNNLAIISGLLELQKEGLDPETINIFEESQSRIQSIAMVHEKLYKSDTLSNISMKEYIDELSTTIEDAYSSKLAEVEIEKNLDEVDLDIMKAIPCGLIFNELINNAFKHAFDVQDRGKLKVTLKKDENVCALSVADNGKGLVENFDIASSDSLGMQLVEALSRQLEADLEINSDDWTEFKVTFDHSKIHKHRQIDPSL